MRQAGALASRKRQALRSFKTLLSAPDLERAIEAHAPRSIDPHRMFTQRDLIVLFLAYLSAPSPRRRRLIQNSPAARCWRYALPAWKGGAAMHGRITALFGAGQAVAAQLGAALFDPAGVPLSKAAEALRQAARQRAGDGYGV